MSNELTPTLGLSIAITVKDEVRELVSLLGALLPYDYGDVPVEIVIQVDSKEQQSDIETRVQPLVELLQSASSTTIPCKWTTFEFTGDFSALKNNLRNNCSYSWILQFDADEYPSQNLIANVLQIVVYSEFEPSLYAVGVPRANRVRGLTQEHVDKWRWQIKPTEEITSLPPLSIGSDTAIAEAKFASDNSVQVISTQDYNLVTASLLVNWPDYQVRLYKNHPSVTWIGKVHETLDIPADGQGAMMNGALSSGVYLVHTKSIEKQTLQNNFYDTLTVDQ